MAQYLINNFAMPTTASPTAVTTGATIKTMLQFKPSATIAARVLRWGFSLDNTAASVVRVSLIETGTVAATVTAATANDIVKYDAAALMGGDQTTNLIQVGTAATGWTASAEGTVTASRLLDGAQSAVTGTTFSYKWDSDFPLGREPLCQIGNIVRIRVTATVAVNMFCYMLVEI